METLTLLSLKPIPFVKTRTKGSKKKVAPSTTSETLTLVSLRGPKKA